MRFSIQSETRALGENWGTAEFWHITLDGKEIATHGRPFTASCAEITLSECEYCYQCGVPHIAVRKISDDTIIWFTNPHDERARHLPEHDLRVFRRQEYEECLNGQSTDLPFLTREELQFVLTEEAFPKWEESLYTLPELENDETGKKTLRAIIEAISGDHIAPCLHDVSSFQSLTIGHNIDNLFETELHFTFNDGEIAFRFQSLPHIPIWLTMVGDEMQLPAIRSWLENAG